MILPAVIRAGRRTSACRRACFSSSSSSSSSAANTQKSAASSVDPLQSLSTQRQVQALLADHASYVLNTYARPPFILSHGKGMYLYDTQSRAYLDFTAGIAVNALGHADEGVAQVIAEQSTQLVHCSNLLNHVWSGETAKLLVEETKRNGGMGFEAPGVLAEAQAQETEPKDITERVQEAVSSGLKVFFANSGTEANEGALKFARKYGKHVDPSGNKVEIVSFSDGFHGRSFGSLSATWQTKYQAPFAPLIPGFVEATYNSIDSINELVNEKTCGVIVEPIQGEGGIMQASEEWLRSLRKRCDEVNAVLIYDEIQCGLGRTGKLWCHSHYPIDCHPDILTMAKPLANGIPVGAIMMKDGVADVVKLGDHGTTFGGAPLQTRVAHHVLSRISQPEFLAHVNRVAAHLHKRLAALASEFPSLVPSEVRGTGLILGLPLANATLPGKVAEMCRDKGVLFLTCGRNTLRFVPSLIVTEKEVDEAMDVLQSTLAELASAKNL